MSSERDKATGLVREFWRECRNDARVGVPRAMGAIAMAKAIGVFSENDAEAWEHALKTCPGHDDEGARNWCAYCGSLAREQEEQDHG